MSMKTFSTNLIHKPNRVDELFSEIGIIQRTGGHSYLNRKGLTLCESELAGVYMVGAQGRITKFTLTCVDCNHEKVVSASETCPRCAGPMFPFGPALPASRYHPGWGKGFWGAEEKICARCGLRVVYEFYDL